MILCLFNPTIKGTWIDQKVQKSWAPSEKQLRSATEDDDFEGDFMTAEDDEDDNGAMDVLQNLFGNLSQH